MILFVLLFAYFATIKKLTLWLNLLILLDLYTWEVSENKLVEHIWDLKCDERLRDGFCKARSRARQLVGTKDWNVLKPFNPKWISNPVWVRLIEDVWSKEEWEKNSEIASANRKSSMDGSISKHVVGSRSFAAHKATLVNRGHLYGFGTLQNPNELLATSSTNTKDPSVNASSQLPQPSEELMNELVKQCLVKLPSMLAELGFTPIVPPTSGGIEAPSPNNVANQSASTLDTDQIRLSASPGKIERTLSSPNHSIQHLDSERNHENVSNEGEGTRSDDNGDEWFR
ncbi:Transposase, Ptta/En/Spm, plant [Corchorus olitorius]|uniref:Transposase, Ptta/En/Spm, plant n=1 Tax=Corchorus olitorius TaxID=93759 RepID=A0A1R3I3C7_9ROSI|nr:Transposase, Ptta/En/Spm, plant [Corchorus olitorius]